MAAHYYAPRLCDYRLSLTVYSLPLYCISHTTILILQIPVSEAHLSPFHSSRFVVFIVCSIVCSFLHGLQTLFLLVYICTQFLTWYSLSMSRSLSVCRLSHSSMCVCVHSVNKTFIAFIIQLLNRLFARTVVFKLTIRNKCISKFIG